MQLGLAAVLGSPQTLRAIIDLIPEPTKAAPPEKGKR